MLIDRVGGGATLALMGVAAVLVSVGFGSYGAIRSARVDGNGEAPAAAEASSPIELEVA